MTSSFELILGQYGRDSKGLAKVSNLIIFSLWANNSIISHEIEAEDEDGDGNDGNDAQASFPPEKKRPRVSIRSTQPSQSVDRKPLDSNRVNPSAALFRELSEDNKDGYERIKRQALRNNGPSARPMRQARFVPYNRGVGLL